MYIYIYTCTYYAYTHMYIWNIYAHMYVCFWVGFDGVLLQHPLARAAIDAACHRVAEPKRFPKQ